MVHLSAEYAVSTFSYPNHLLLLLHLISSHLISSHHFPTPKGQNPPKLANFDFWDSSKLPPPLNELCLSQARIKTSRTKKSPQKEFPTGSRKTSSPHPHPPSHIHISTYPYICRLSNFIWAVRYTHMHPKLCFLYVHVHHVSICPAVYLYRSEQRHFPTPIPSVCFILYDLGDRLLYY
jgi:hypothetical protein